MLGVFRGLVREGREPGKGPPARSPSRRLLFRASSAAMSFPQCPRGTDPARACPAAPEGSPGRRVEPNHLKRTEG